MSIILILRVLIRDQRFLFISKFLVQLNNVIIVSVTVIIYLEITVYLVTFIFLDFIWDFLISFIHIWLHVRFYRADICWSNWYCLIFKSLAAIYFSFCIKFYWLCLFSWSSGNYWKSYNSHSRFLHMFHA
jgi:hypothetical protein